MGIGGRFTPENLIVINLAAFDALAIENNGTRTCFFESQWQSQHISLTALLLGLFTVSESIHEYYSTGSYYFQFTHLLIILNVRFPCSFRLNVNRPLSPCCAIMNYVVE